MKNKLTLKSLQQELERMKSESSALKSSVKNKPVSSADITKSGVGHDIKDSFIQRMYVRSSAFSLFLITGLLGYATKIPIIRKVLGLLGIFYGRTTIWKVISKIRRGFVLLNAAIGVYMVYKSVGFSTDNIIAGFGGMGHTYFELLINTTKRLFNWFVELFDHKIIPNAPTDKPTMGPTFHTDKSLLPWPRNPIEQLKPGLSSTYAPPMKDFRDLFTSPFSINIDNNINTTPWYRDWSSLLWIAGGVITIGTMYLGYKFITDPSFIDSIFNRNLTSSTTNTPTPGSSTGPGTIEGDAPIELHGRVPPILNGLKNMYNVTINTLNPFNWFISVSESESQFKAFMEVQNDYVRSNMSLYPFTNNNPYDSWFKKLRLHWLGETQAEITQRNLLLEYANRTIEDVMKSGKGKSVEQITNAWSSNVSSPLPPIIGLPPAFPSGGGLVDALNVAEYNRTASKLSTIPSTPGLSGQQWIRTPELPASELTERLNNLKGIYKSATALTNTGESTISLDKTLD